MIDPRRLLSQSWAYSAFRKFVSRDGTGNRLVSDFLKIEPGMRILDVGCGPADVLISLPEGIDYHGYDADPNYIAAARARFGSRGTFEVRSVSPEAVDEIGTFDAVIALGVLHHLDDDEVRTLFAGAAKVLRPGGRVVTLDGAFVPNQNPIAKAMLLLDRGHHVRTPEAYASLARTHFGEVRQTILHDLIAVPYTHLVLESSLPKSAAADAQVAK